MKSIVLTILVATVLLMIAKVFYERAKIKEYANIMSELLNKEIGLNTKSYLTKEIEKIEYELQKNVQKYKKIPILKELYKDEINYYKMLLENDEQIIFGNNEELKLVTIIETKLKYKVLWNF
ncbi:hypothetical protein [Senegalia massiliensis]|uniref:Uncharacterized protein n=1 Tax=Senegalia massiliensis TaxID=1720316 RepID=A0A845QX92_9CLOT|nr:hypothetical protein [Senegalia massiliensis]NBI07567.1 hypothetical protein [Senegalia massiliensis]